LSLNRRDTCNKTDEDADKNRGFQSHRLPPEVWLLKWPYALRPGSDRWKEASVA
jgi:hypothetical protein